MSASHYIAHVGPHAGSSARHPRLAVPRPLVPTITRQAPRRHRQPLLRICALVTACAGGAIGVGLWDPAAIERYWQQGAPQSSLAAMLATPATPSEPAAPPPMPAADQQALFLVRTTLLALNDANRSGNYSVLRDLAGPRFQARITAARLAALFEGFRRNNIDLGVAALLTPRFASPASPPVAGRLQLTGDIPAAPAAIAFDLAFEEIDGHWRLLDLSVGLRGP